MVRCSARTDSATIADLHVRLCLQPLFPVTGAQVFERVWLGVCAHSLVYSRTAVGLGRRSWEFCPIARRDVLWYRSSPTGASGVDLVRLTLSVEIKGSI